MVIDNKVLTVGEVSCPHYDLVPRDFLANIKFRHEMMRMGGTDDKAAAQLKTMCAEDMLFYVNAFCLASGTLVVTRRGLVPIEAIQPFDVLWDGDNWISHEGLLTKGRKSVIFAYGIWLTPNHKVRTTHGWQNASEGFDRAEVRLPDGYSEGGAWSRRRRSPSAEVQQTAEVYDLLNCGPKQAFAVIDSNGVPLLVHNCFTYDPRSQDSVTPFITYKDYQDDAMLNVADCVIAGEDCVTPKSRDMGASWMGLTVFEWFWHFRENLSFLLISRNEDYVDKRGNPKSLFWKIDFLHIYQPHWLLPTGRWLGDKDPQRRLLHMGNADNGSVIDGESTTGDAGRGDRRTAMFIDEHAAFEINDGFRVLKASRDTTKCRVFNSTPQGSNNGFSEVVHNTNARLIRLHWSLHPEKNKGLYTMEGGHLKLLDGFTGEVSVKAKGENRAKQVKFPAEYPFRLDGKLRSPWYDNECARCVSEVEIGQELDIDFLGSDYQFFDPEFIGILRKKFCRPHLALGALEYDNESCTPKRFVDNRSSGKLYLWLSLTGAGKVPTDRKFVVGSDISAGTGASNSVSCVVDRETGEKVGCLRTPNLRPTEFANYSIALAKFFNNAFMIWDASGPTGKTFTQRVVKVCYRNIYYRRNEKKVGRDVTDEPGYYLNSKARESLLEDYRAALSDHKYINFSDSGMKECLQFIRKADGTIEHSASAHSQDPSGARTAHGDEVIADALACLGITERESRPAPTEPEIPPGSLAWRRKVKADAEAQSCKDELGPSWH